MLQENSYKPRAPSVASLVVMSRKWTGVPNGKVKVKTPCFVASVVFIVVNV